MATDYRTKGHLHRKHCWNCGAFSDLWFHSHRSEYREWRCYSDFGEFWFQHGFVYYSKLDDEIRGDGA